MVAERDRVGEVVEAESVLRETRNGQRARDRAEGEHQPVVVHLEGPGVRLDRHRARSFVEGGRRADDELDRGHIIRSGTTTWRGSSVAEAASASSGRNSMKFSGLTIVAAPTCRARMEPA